MPTSSWGPHVWAFIHTFAYHMSNEFFIENRRDIIDTLFGICYYLPCMDCAVHAKSFLIRVNKNKIQTKDDLKRLFYDFHNIVNKRLKRDEFTDFDIYSTYSLKNTFLNFKIAYTENAFLRNQLHITLLRKKLCNKVDNMIKKNLSQFTLL